MQFRIYYKNKPRLSWSLQVFTGITEAVTAASAADMAAAVASLPEAEKAKIIAALCAGGCRFQLFPQEALERVVYYISLQLNRGLFL